MNKVKEAIVAAKATKASKGNGAIGATEENYMGKAAQNKSREAGRTAQTGRRNYEDDATANSDYASLRPPVYRAITSTTTDTIPR